MKGNYGETPASLQDYEKLYAIWLAEALGCGSKLFKPLIEKYGSFESIYNLNEKQYIESGVENATTLKRLLDKDLASSGKVFGFCKHYYFGILVYTSEHYPKRLKSISNPPPVLYVRGKWIDFNSNVCIAVVGTRSYSEQGWKSTYMISEGLAKCGAVVVTGLASGIDTAAASASLASSGLTVGVLGTGIERIYPSENKPLFDKMYENGMLISELPPFSPTSPSYFPVRNRIISGLCHGVLVGEGEEKSGAMITAAHAAEQGRHIFAIPGDITNPESSGVNKLINEGATPVFDAWNILEKYYYAYPHRITKLEKANGSYVPPERSSTRIRVQKGKRKTVAKESGAVPTPAEIIADAPQMPAKKTKAQKVLSDVTVNDEITPPTADEETVHDPYEVLEEMLEIHRLIYEAVPKDGGISYDGIVMKLGVNAGEVISRITELETAGLLTSGSAGIVRGGKKKTEH